MGEIFERAAPAVPLEFTGERLTTSVDGQIQIEHLHRYFFARELCRGLDVLDVASGEGYGTALLAQTARSVVGVEVSGEAVAHATQAYSGANFQYLQGDARSLPLDDDSVDVVVSFETIEHFYEQERFVAEVRRVLRPGGRFIVSSPERDVFSPSGSVANTFHVRELSGEQFKSLLLTTFDHVHMLGQRPMVGSALVADRGSLSATLTFEKRGPHAFEASSGMPRSVYWIAIASDRPVEQVPDSVYIDTGDVATVLAAAEVFDAVAAERSALVARADAAESAAASTASNLAAAISQAKEQEESHGRRMQEMDRASHDHATRAQVLEAVLAEVRGRANAAEAQANQQHEAHNRQMQEMDRASHDHAAKANALARELAEVRGQASAAEAELARAIGQAHQQLESHNRQMQEMDRASHDHAARAEVLERELGEVRGRADVAEADLAHSIEKVGAFERELTEMRAEVTLAWQQRDIARVVARRAMVASEGTWRAKVSDLESQVAEWQQRYFGLRARLDAILRRFWILRASRLIPAPIRQSLRNKLLNRPQK